MISDTKLQEMAQGAEDALAGINRLIDLSRGKIPPGDVDIVEAFAQIKGNIMYILAGLRDEAIDRQSRDEDEPARHFDGRPLRQDGVPSVRRDTYRGGLARTSSGITGR